MDDPAPEPTTLGYSLEALWNHFDLRTNDFRWLSANRSETNARLLNWIGSVDSSGWIRESCVRELIQNYVPGDENRILLRLADWVPAIRAIARDWILREFHRLPFPVVKDNQKLLLYLLRRESIPRDEAGLVEIVSNLLARADELTKEEFFGLTPRFRRALFVLSLERSGSLRRWIPLDPEPFTRRLLLTHSAVGPLSPEERAAFTNDRAPAIRRAYLSLMISREGKVSREELTALSLDPNRRMRYLAAFYLHSLHGVDVHALYRQQTGARAYYLADFAKAEDADIFVQGALHGDRRTQLNCVRALAASCEARLLELDLKSLILSNRDLRAVILPRLPALLEVAQVIALWNSLPAGSSGVALGVLGALEKKSYWHFAEVAVDRMLDNPSGGERTELIALLQRRAAIPDFPKTLDRPQLLDKIEGLRTKDPSLSSRLAFFLRTA